MTTTPTNPHEKYTRAWFAWNGRKGGRAGIGASKRRTREHYEQASAAGRVVKRSKSQPAETDPYSGT